MPGGLLREVDRGLRRVLDSELQLWVLSHAPSPPAPARLAPMAARRFRPAARVALFLAARGRCADCGVALEPGWHADHVRPARAGGATGPANGRALCPRCNLAKGGRLA